MTSSGAPQGKNDNLLKMVGLAFFSLPKLSFSFLCGYLGMKRRANKGSRIFKKQLRKQGMSKQQINELTELYLKPCKVSTYIQAWTS